ncbi:unnamed protein product [Rhizoctonia solani]|uniref:DUF7918 domain-containing protein n=1 Tax=Rhizoctonia solani TaxID=456999 RepID=A0A8H2WZ10_9AGAM|nr:unnamed protein product [Rhizoctonia solani]
MLLEPLGLRVYITDTTGTPLPEYQEKQTKDDSIECWVPSTEGTNFQIHWEMLNRTATTVDCDTCAIPYFDGIKLKGKIATNGKNRGKLYGHPVGPDSIRLYQFGKRKFTDEEDNGLSSNATSVEDLGTIRVVIDWGQKVPKGHTSRSFKDTDPASGTVNEKLAKKGFWDVAGLGPSTGSRRQIFYNFVEKKDALSGNFLFHYASEGIKRSLFTVPPPSSSAMPNPKRSHTLNMQVGGHKGVKQSGEGDLIMKPCLPAERDFYQAIAADQRLAALGPYVPKFYGTLRLEGQVKTEGEVGADQLREVLAKGASEPDLGKDE